MFDSIRFVTGRGTRPPRCIIAALALIAPLAIAVASPAEAQADAAGAQVRSRHMDTQRARAANNPRSEGDQAIVDGWPLYRTERGQVAFNDAMATLKATEGPAPMANAFRGCAALDCALTLPDIGDDGWLPAGRYWVSPGEYVLIVHSHRNRSGSGYRRRSIMSMSYFVFHEFHNSTRNTDIYDTISSHSSSVFVPLYMSKQMTDAKGRRFVVVVQVAPHDVVSVHASNMGSAGPGIEVAKNVSDQLEPLQALAGILVATMVKEAVPRLKVVNHRGNEGLPMLQAYQRRLASIAGRAGAAKIVLPFVPASPQRIAAATGRLEDLILKRGASPPLAVADRGVIPRGLTPSNTFAAASSSPPMLLGPIMPAARRARDGTPQLVAPVTPAERPARLGSAAGG